MINLSVRFFRSAWPSFLDMVLSWGNGMATELPVFRCYSVLLDMTCERGEFKETRGFP